MTTHVIKLDRYCASAEGVRGRLVLGTWNSYGIEQLQLVLGDGWDERTVTAVFHGPKASTGTTVLAGSDGLVDVPQEATANAGYGTITIVGVDESSQRISVDIPYVVMSHAPVTGQAPDPTPDQWQQFVAQVQGIVDKAVPPGGNDGDVLTKTPDGNAWQPPQGGGGGGTTGQDGGYYTPSIQQPTDSTAQVSWTASDDTMPPVDPVTLKLPQGPQGIPGLPGQDGQQGPPGADGKDGAQGPQGEPGASGKDGVTPTIGENGNWYIGDVDTGKPSRGEEGPAGQDGAQGPQGIPGPQGEPGPTGPQGPAYTLTESDKQTIVQAVLAALPNGDEVSY